jgi:16S rRNA (adenine1518-N6/adenine1519-N6)-dimethyltransferase
MSESLLKLLDEGKLLKYTRLFLLTYGLRARKKLGQNFIVSKRVVNSYVESLKEIHNLMILEVGTGLGAITYFIAKRYPDRTIVTIEKDPLIYDVVKNVLGSLSNAVFVLGDALNVLQEARVSTIISSTPYQLSTEILLRAARNNSINNAVLGVQREVAQRLVGKPGSENYGRISVISQLLFNIEVKGHYSPKCFYPQPEVSGVIVILRRKKKYDTKIHSRLEKLTECLFSYRNKLAQKVLSLCIDKLTNSNLTINYSELEINDKTRVRELRPETIEKIVEKYLA